MLIFVYRGRFAAPRAIRFLNAGRSTDYLAKIVTRAYWVMSHTCYISSRDSEVVVFLGESFYGRIGQENRILSDVNRITSTRTRPFKQLVRYVVDIIW
jgi:hypothetical protein